MLKWPADTPETGGVWPRPRRFLCQDHDGHAAEVGVKGEASAVEATRRRTSVFFYFWMALLGWLVLGSALAQMLTAIGMVGSFCKPPEIQQDVYPACDPCVLTSGMFGAVEMTPCPNAALLTVSDIGMTLPHVVVITLAIFVSVLEEALRRISIFLPALVLMAPLVLALARTVYVNFIARPHIARGLNRAGLICLALLAVNFAMLGGGAWPWLRTG